MEQNCEIVFISQCYWNKLVVSVPVSAASCNVGPFSGSVLRVRSSSDG